MFLQARNDEKTKTFMYLSNRVREINNGGRDGTKGMRVG